MRQREPLITEGRLVFKAAAVLLGVSLIGDHHPVLGTALIAVAGVLLLIDLVKP